MAVERPAKVVSVNAHASSSVKPNISQPNATLGGANESRLC